MLCWVLVSRGDSDLDFLTETIVLITDSLDTDDDVEFSATRVDVVDPTESVKVEDVELSLNKRAARLVIRRSEGKLEEPEFSEETTRFLKEGCPLDLG